MRRACAAFAILAVTGCATGPQATAPSATPSQTPSYPSPTIVRAESTSDLVPGAALSPTGLGPLELGLSVAEGRDRGWVGRLAHCDRWGSSPALLAEGVDLMFDDTGRLAEIWLGNPRHRTAEWARVGMHIEDITALYRDRLEFERRDSVGGSLVVAFVRDGENELVFYALGDEDERPGPAAPVSAIGARAHGRAIERPAC